MVNDSERVEDEERVTSVENERDMKGEKADSTTAHYWSGKTLWWCGVTVY